MRFSGESVWFMGNDGDCGLWLRVAGRPFQGSVGVQALSLAGQSPLPKNHQSPLTNHFSPTHIPLELIIFTPAMMMGR